MFLKYRKWLLLLIIPFLGSFYFLLPEKQQFSGVGKPIFNAQAEQVYEICNLALAKRTSLESDLAHLKAKNADNSLRALNAQEKAEMKGCEIAKLVSIPKTQQGSFFVEVVSFERKTWGITAFVRAWNANNEQIGFGDGTVDIERMNFINPPVLVPDTLGAITRSYSQKEIDGTITTFERKYTEDVQKALLISIEQVLKSRERQPSNKIVTGKIGNTTTSMRPDPDVEVNSVDGYAMRNGAGGEPFSTTRSGAGDEVSDTTATQNRPVTSLSAGNYFIAREVFLFYDGGVITTDQVSSSTVSFYANGQAINNVDSTSFVITDTFPTATTSLATGDYNIERWNGTQYATTALSAWVTTDGTQNIFTLGADGYDKIEFDAANNGGVIRIGVRMALDLNNSAPTGLNDGDHYYADQTGTVNDPLLVADHAAAAVDVLPAVPGGSVWWIE